MNDRSNSDVSCRPAWAKDAVFYQIFPDRFARSERVLKPANLLSWHAPPSLQGYHGGDLLGITERLDYLVDLGINAIYLNPIFQSACNHRYHTHDYENVDPLLGGNSRASVGGLGGTRVSCRRAPMSGEAAQARNASVGMERP